MRRVVKDWTDTLSVFEGFIANYGGFVGAVSTSDFQHFGTRLNSINSDSAFHKREKSSC
jgi:hypothetical protein